MDERPIGDIRMDGGEACLDFVNTIHDRKSARREDYLSTPERFVEWSRRAGLLSAHERPTIPRSARRCVQLLRDVVVLREAIHALLSARLAGTAAPARARRELQRWLREGWADSILCAAPQGGIIVTHASSDWRVVMFRIATSTLARLRDESQGHPKACPACGWLFVDNTKNGSRRWCAMETCGTAAKMRSYRRARPMRAPSSRR